MLEVVALSALTAFLTAVGNGAAGEMGKQLLLSTGALANRTMGRQTPLPTTPEGAATLAREMHPRLGGNPAHAGEWALLLRSAPDQETHALPGGTLPPAPQELHRPPRRRPAAEAGSDTPGCDPDTRQRGNELILEP